MRRHFAMVSGCVVAAGLCLPAAGFDPVTFHLMQIEQVVGGVGGDVTAQAVQLRMRSFNQNFVAAAKVMAYDANGENPVVLIDFASQVPNGDLGDRILIVTEAMQNFTEPAVVGDFTFTNPIPESYLAAGRITFENNSGTQVLWALHSGGDSYTGSTEGTLDNDNDGDFGPPFDGAFPTDGAALLFQGGPSDKSSTNQEDYALTNALAVLTNNAGDSYQVVLPPDECYPDFTGDDLLDLFDFLAFVNAFNAGSDDADCIADGLFDLFDFLCFVNAFNAGC
jgi:hypothetical protein